MDDETEDKGGLIGAILVAILLYAAVCWTTSGRAAELASPQPGSVTVAPR